MPGSPGNQRRVSVANDPGLPVCPSPIRAWAQCWRPDRLLASRLPWLEDNRSFRQRPYPLSEQALAKRSGPSIDNPRQSAPIRASRPNSSQRNAAYVVERPASERPDGQSVSGPCDSINRGLRHFAPPGLVGDTEFPTNSPRLPRHKALLDFFRNRSANLA